MQEFYSNSAGVVQSLDCKTHFDPSVDKQHSSSYELFFSCQSRAASSLALVNLPSTSSFAVSPLFSAKSVWDQSLVPLLSTWIDFTPTLHFSVTQTDKVQRRRAKELTQPEIILKDSADWAEIKNEHTYGTFSLSFWPEGSSCWFAVNFSLVQLHKCWFWVTPQRAFTQQMTESV